MRILSLTFKNLNSLYGTWTVDFTAPEYREGGLFAITGPTGSGKSTILDAICLALYGSTPRLGRVTQGGNEIMSRHTGECSAEVVFETRDGSFIATWSQRRARKKAGGALQPPKHEVARSDGTIIESKLSLTEKEIEKRTAMDFDRFTRTMLLAQGGFAKFLDADANERSPILEQITGTEIYSTISIKVHERLREEREKLQTLRTELDGIVLLTDDEIAELSRGISAAETEMVKLEKEREALRKGQEWYRSLKRLEEERAAAAEKRDTAHAARDAFTPDNNRLQSALRAAEIEGEYSLLEMKRRECAKCTGQLCEFEESLRQLTEEIKNGSVLRDAGEKELEECRKTQTEHIPLLRQVRELDAEGARLENERSGTAAAAQKEQEALILAEDELKQARAEKETTDESLRKGIRWREDNAADGALSESAPLLAERISQIVAAEKKSLLLKKEIESVGKALNQARTHLDRCIKERLDAETRKKDVTAQLEQKKGELKTLLEGATLAVIRRERDAVVKEKYYVGKINSLEKERQHLVDGEPCPLCGATEHPFAAGADVPDMSAVDTRLTALEQKITRAEALEAAVAEGESAALKCGDACTEKSQLQTKAESEVKVLEHSFESKRKEAADNTATTEELRQYLTSQLQPFGMVLPDKGRENELSGEIFRRTERWKKAIERLKKLEQDAPVADKACALAVQKRDVLAGQCRKNEDSLRKLEADIVACREKRTSLFGDRNPDIVESEDAAAYEKAETGLKKLTAQLAERERESAAVSGKTGDLRERISALTEEVRSKEEAFLVKCASAGFDTVARFSEAMLDPSERTRLREMKDRIDSDCTGTESLVRHQESLLEDERKKKVTDIPSEALDEQFTQCDGQVRQLSESLGALRQKIAADATARSRVSGRRELLEAQQKECERWERLHLLIGSADGKKFRNFAQGITFEYLLAHANRQLGILSDRYLLTGSPDAPLELFVVDNYQAGEIRTARNLSGGESFIVSLALALGLSSMAGRTVRVDSLFLDEGFGTLDEETLETALETLAGLHQHGKCIGVISHIPALKERIATRIVVTPETGGKSVLSGPGCRREEE